MENILLTRSHESSLEILQVLEAKGHKVFVEPLFNVTKTNVVAKPHKAQAVIISSSNACEVLIKYNLPKDIKIFSVGKKTAEKLQLVGFNNISVSAKNSAESLLDLILETWDKKTVLLYFHGSIVTMDFAFELEKQGFAVQKILAYETEENSDFSAQLLEKCTKEAFDKVLIFSENSVRIFFKLAQKNNVLEYFMKAQILCFSEKILNEAKRLGFKKCATFSDFPILANFYD